MRHFFQNITVRMFFTGAAMALSGQQWADPVSEHVLPVAVSSLVLQDAPRVVRPAFHVCCPFLGLGTRLLALWVSSRLGWLPQRPPACLVGMSWAVLSAGFALCALRRAAGFPEAGSRVWSLCISSCRAFVFSGERNSLARKEFPLKLTLQCWFWTGSKRSCSFYICASAAGVPDKFLWRNSLKS